MAKFTNLSELAHLYEVDVVSAYDDFSVAHQQGDKRNQSMYVRKLLKIVRALNRDIGKVIKKGKRKVSLSGSRIPEWFWEDAESILHDMWTAKAVEEFVISTLKVVRKKSPARDHASITATIEATRSKLKTILRISKAEIMRISPDFWNETYEEDFKKYLTR